MAVLVFLVVAYGGAWLISLPLWLGDGLTSPLFLPIGLTLMLTPALGALVASRVVLRRRHLARSLGLVPVRPWRRTIGYSLLGLVGLQVVALIAVLLGAALGISPLVLGSSTWPALAAAPIVSALTAIPALGEEIGWRGFLLPTLRPLGTWPALLLTGLVWGPWHAPVILLGYNYGITSPIGLVLMTVTTLLVGVLFGWLRMRSGSVWPAAFAHGALNGSTGLLLVALLPGTDSIAPTLLGWIGWALLSAIIAVLVARRSFRWGADHTGDAADVKDDVDAAPITVA